MRRAIAAILTAAAMLGVCSATASAARSYEVPWTVDAALFAQGQKPDSPPPGANDFDCRSRIHPQPVILVHGLLANQTVNWRTISPYLKNRGFCVFSLTYGTKDRVDSPLYQPGGLRTMQSSARELKSFIHRVRDRTGARKVDIVGHSEGSLMPSWYVRFLGGGKVVDDYVGMTTLWNGTNPAGLATLNRIATTLGFTPALKQSIDRFCSSCRQFLKGSRFFERLHERGVTSRRVDYTSIVTKNDELVVPYTSGLLPKAPNVRNVVLQDYCRLDQAEHLSVFADPVTAGFIWRALDPKRATKPPCVPVLPFVGAPGYTGD
jgi:triacylglycerol lipase